MGFRAGFLLLLSLLGSQAHAYESEQFTVPPQPLEDLGPGMNSKVLAVTNIAAQKLNFQGVTEHAQFHTALALAIEKELGVGLPETRAERWAKEFKSAGLRFQYQPSVFASIYSFVFSTIPGSFIYLSPTVKLFGTHLGCDKIGHFFQQGYEYFTAYRKGLEKGKTPDEATADAVKGGVRQEHTYYGTGIDGVYSNADLAANYSGFKFYLNLVEPVKIGETELPPMFEQREDGKWFVRDSLSQPDFFRVFISDYFDESMNPSRYTFNRGRIREAIRDRCTPWLAAHPLVQRETEDDRMLSLQKWFGEDYGYLLPRDQEASIRSECFQRP